MPLELRIEAPPEFDAIRRRFENISLGEGPPIRVILANESSELAQSAPPWVAGYASNDVVIIFPSRSPSYPHDTLEDVLRHEVAHVSIRRNAGGRRVPRWFNEGLAMAAERRRRFRDETQLLYQLVTGSRTSLVDLDRLFGGTQANQTRAYALAGAFVQDLLERHGASTGTQILDRMRRGADFDAAFAGITGATPEAAAADFWQRQRIWTIWTPIITSESTLWMAVTIIALLAIYRRARRNKEIERRWEEEEGTEEDSQ